MDWTQIPNDSVIEKTIEALKPRGITAYVVENKEEARKKVWSLLPDESKVLTSTSVTLEEIGIHDEIERSDKIISVRKEYMALDHEKDNEKIRVIRSTPEIVIGSVHAVTQDGQIIVASNTGSQIGPYVYTAKKVIWVVGAQKIVQNYNDGVKRLEEYVVPLEEKHMQSLYGIGTNISKLLIFNKEVIPERVILIFVKERLGF